MNQYVICCPTCTQLEIVVDKIKIIPAVLHLLKNNEIGDNGVCLKCNTGYPVFLDRYEDYKRDSERIIDLDISCCMDENNHIDFNRVLGGKEINFVGCGICGREWTE